MRYVKKTSAVEAIKLDCECTLSWPVTCAEDDRGYQEGRPGDYLVKENGQCFIVKAATFEKNYIPEPPPMTPQPIIIQNPPATFPTPWAPPARQPKVTWGTGPGLPDQRFEPMCYMDVDVSMP